MNHQDRLRPSHAALGPEQYGTKEVHLLHRNTDVTEKPGSGEQTWSSNDYSASLSAAAEGRHARFQQAASALSPYAADDSSSSHAHASATGHQMPHHGHFVSPAPKVGKPAISLDAYAGALQASAAAKQQRYDRAAAAPAPFAVDEEEMQVGRRYTAGAAHTQAPFATDDEQGSRAGGNRRPARGTQAPAPFAVDEGRGGMASGKPHGEGYHYHKPEHPEASGKVGAAPRDDEECAEQCRQRAAAQDASRVRNRGTVGLLG